MGFPLRYLHATLPADRERHHRLYLQSRPTGVAVALEPDGDFYRATIVGRDRPYLFASFAAALSAAGLDVVKAEAFSNARGVILDTFVVADPRGLLHKDVSAADRLRESLERIGLGRLEAPPARVAGPADRKKRGLAPTVRFDSGGCEAATLVEVVAENRPGLLCSLASVFSSAACNIDVVLVDTKGNRALDVFYVARDGKKLTPELESALRDRLLAAC